MTLKINLENWSQDNLIQKKREVEMGFKINLSKRRELEMTLERNLIEKKILSIHGKGRASQEKSSVSKDGRGLMKTTCSHRLENDHMQRYHATNRKTRSNRHVSGASDGGNGTLQWE